MSDKGEHMCVTAFMSDKGEHVCVTAPNVVDVWSMGVLL